jgi:Fe-S-cluster containining protein
VHIGATFGAIEHEIARKVEDHLDAAGGEDALALVRSMIHAGVPQHADEGRKRGGGDALQVEQGDLGRDPQRRVLVAECLEAVIARCVVEMKSGAAAGKGEIRYAERMGLPAGDTQLVQIVDAALADTQCCHGAFAINALDAERLKAGMQALHAADPRKAEAVEERAKAWIAEWGPEFPGDAAAGLLGTTEEEQERFEDFANEAACPALDPTTGLCDVYAWRPMTCRVFGPPTRMGSGDALGCCELCLVGASEEQIAKCEMPVPHEVEERLMEAMGDPGETVVAFALLR